jgi:tetratricopeptide (TPR) repeat protein
MKLLSVVIAIMIGSTWAGISAKSLMVEGEKSYGLGNYAKAAKYFLKATRSKDPFLVEKAPFVWYNLGQTLIQMEKLPMARSAFLRVLDLAPNMVKSHQALGYIALKVNEPSDARKHFTYLLEAGDSTAWIGLGEAAWLAGDWPGAYLYYEKVLVSDSSNARTWLLLADCKEKMFDFKGAVEVLLKGREQLFGSGVGLSLRLAKLYDHLEESSKALDLLEESLIYSPANLPLRIALAARYQLENRAWMAALTLEEGLGYDKSGGLHQKLGHVLHGMGRFEEAFDMYAYSYKKGNVGTKFYLSNSLNALFNIGEKAKFSQLSDKLEGL